MNMRWTKMILLCCVLLSLFIKVGAQTAADGKNATAINDEKLGNELIVTKDHQHALPVNLSLSGTTLLSITDYASEAYPLYKSLRDVMHVNWINVKPDSLSAVQDRLIPAQQIIVAIYSSKIADYDGLLAQLGQDKPVVWAFFADTQLLNFLPHGYRSADAVVLVPTRSADTQDYVARLLIGRVGARGKLEKSISDDIPAGTGIIIDPEQPRNYHPEDVGMNATVLTHVDSIANDGIRQRVFPGCHVVIMRNGLPIYNKSFGNLDYEGQESVSEHTLYDLGELTETTGTLLALMKLYDEGKFGLTDLVKKYVQPYKDAPIGQLSISDLLHHDSGLPETWPFYHTAIDLTSVPDGLFSKIQDVQHRLQIDDKLFVNTTFKYAEKWLSSHIRPDFNIRVSDSMFLNNNYRYVIQNMLANIPVKHKSPRYSTLDFIVLRQVVEAISGLPLDAYLNEHFFVPMGLIDTAFKPLDFFGKNDIAPSVSFDFLRHHRVQGTVYNHEAAFLGGVGGNAGLFSTAMDIAKIYQLYLNKGVLGDKRYFSRATASLFLTPAIKDVTWGMGFIHPHPERQDNNLYSVDFGPSSFGQVGTTGCCVWADPVQNLVFVFVSNSIYPNEFTSDKKKTLDIMRNMQHTMYQSIIR